jgi:hypothetical protein
MSVAVAEEPRILHTLPGRLRVHLPEWSGQGIISLTFASSLLGLAVTAGESLGLLTEVHARRTAWRRFEEREANAPSSQPDAVIRPTS